MESKFEVIRDMFPEIKEVERKEPVRYHNRMYLSDNINENDYGCLL